MLIIFENSYKYFIGLSYMSANYRVDSIFYSKCKILDYSTFSLATLMIDFIVGAW